MARPKIVNEQTKNRVVQGFVSTAAYDLLKTHCDQNSVSQSEVIRKALELYFLQQKLIIEHRAREKKILDAALEKSLLESLPV